MPKQVTKSHDFKYYNLNTLKQFYFRTENDIVYF